MNPNVAFVAEAGAGKTYCCQYLIKKYGYIPGKMATSLYGIAKQYFGMDEKNKDRRLLQYMGTDIGRKELDNDIWVKRFAEDTLIVQRTYKDLYNKDIYFCSDDVRFRNEYLALKEKGWVLIYLAVPEQIRISRLQSRDGDSQLSTLNHASELEIATFKDDLIQLDASGTLEQTYQRLEETLEYIRREINERV